MTADELLTQASEIAELRDMDRFQPMFDELTRWRPEHQGECAHCAAVFVAHYERLVPKYQLDPVWVARLMQTLFTRAWD